MTFALIHYWVEGDRDAIRRLKEVIDNADGMACKALENLGLDPDDFDCHGRAEWCDAAVEDRDGYSVLSFIEYYPYEMGSVIFDLTEHETFKGKLTEVYYYAEETANSGLCTTNDAQGKYWLYRYYLTGNVPIDVDDNEDLDLPDIEGYLHSDKAVLSFGDGYTLEEYFTTEEAVMEFFKYIRHPITSQKDIEEWDEELQKDDKGYISLYEINV